MLAAESEGVPAWGSASRVEGLTPGRVRLGRSVAPLRRDLSLSSLRANLGLAAGDGQSRAWGKGGGAFPAAGRVIETRLSGDHCARTLSVDDARDVARLTHCKIRLGRAPRLVEDSCYYAYDASGNALPWGEYYLEAEVPELYDGLASFEDMLRAYVPEWYETVCGTSKWVDRAEQSLRALDSRLVFSGKNWTSDVCGNAVVLAIAQIQAYAHLAEGPEMFSGPCGLTADNIREKFEKGKIPIHVLACGLDRFREPCVGRMELVSSSLTLDDAGALTARRTTGVNDLVGLTTVGGIYLHASFLVNAAIADYYFWWARRLLAAGSFNQSFIGYLCARAALAELSEIGEVIVHELGHRIGGVGPHCGTPPLSKANCCNVVSQYFYFHRMAAEVGHSMGHFWWGGDNDFGVTRYFFGLGRTLEGAFEDCPESGGRGVGGESRPNEWNDDKLFDYYHLAGGGCTDGYEGCHVYLSARHGDWWTGPNALDLLWEFRDGTEDATASQLLFRGCQDPADLYVRDGDAVSGTVHYSGGG